MISRSVSKLVASTLTLGSALVLVACATGPAITYNSPQDWVNQSKQGTQLPLGTKAGEWSEPKTFTTKSGGNLTVRSEFVKQHGTTCHYNVEFSNTGKTKIIGTAGLSKDDKLNVYSHNSGRVNLEPGKKVAYDDLEARECPLKWGESTEMDTCASCMTTLLLAE